MERKLALSRVDQLTTSGPGLKAILGMRVPKWNMLVLLDVVPCLSVPAPRTMRRVFSLEDYEYTTKASCMWTYVAINDIAYTVIIYENVGMHAYGMTHIC